MTNYTTQDYDQLHAAYISQCSKNADLIRQITALERRVEQLGDAVLTKSGYKVAHETRRIIVERASRAERMAMGIQL